ncbi:MAG: hypothetical protein JRI96_18160 [Deltaproteobacteria bacterium]|nr:hypothetical protein [Deltaproteobacteria bacterium]
MNQEEPEESVMPRIHYVINDKERLDYDPGGGDGFKTMDLRHNFHISRQGSDYVIVRTVSDYADQLDPPDIYWAWVRITTDSLTPDDESEGAASEETIEDVFDDGGSIVNLGTDLNNPLNIPLSKSDMFVKVLEWPVVDVGTRLHSSCLDEAANPYTISVMKLYSGGRVDVKGSGWGEINMEDVTATARKIPKQGLQQEETHIVNKNSLRVVNDKQGNQFSTRTPIDYQERIVRKIEGLGVDMEVESRRIINEDKYNWESSY